MIDESPKRFDRIIAILIQLQSCRIVKARELADRFQVSLRTIYRDMQSLEDAGVPILAEAGQGYSIMEGYRLPPVMFTREEAASFVAAEKIMQQMTDKSLGAYFSSAMFKIKSVLHSRDKEWINSIQSQILVRRGQELFNENVPNALEIIMESIAEQKQVDLTYSAFEAAGPVRRIIEPVGLFHEFDYWYILGYCHLRKDYRQFRTDRIIKIERTGQFFINTHASLQELRNKDSRQEEKMLIKILVDKRIARHIQSSKKYYGFTEETDLGDQIAMTFLTCEFDEGFPRWFMMFGDSAEIIEPASMKERVHELAMRTLERQHLWPVPESRRLDS